jgi:hypothetical protein
MKLLFRLALLLLLVPVSAGAHIDPPSPIGADDIYGTWEAVFVQRWDIRVFRMELRQEGGSRLAFALRGGVGFVGILTSANVRNGELRLAFQDSDIGPINVVGKGWRFDDDLPQQLNECQRRTRTGVMMVELIMSPQDPHPTVWKLTFERYAEYSITEELRELARTASEAIESGISTPGGKE